MGSNATIAPNTVSVEPGGQAVVQVRVRNTGTIVDEFSFELLGDSVGWGVFTPPTLNLFPQNEGTVSLTFRPPKDPAPAQGLCPVGVRIRSREDPDNPSVEELTLDIAPVRATTAELVPRTTRGRRRAVTELAVDNRGNARLQIELAGTDPDDQLHFAFRPPSVVVEPGAAAFSRVTLAPRNRFLRGPNRTLPFGVRLSPEGEAPFQVDGSMLQEPVIPPWFVRALVAVLAGLVLLAIAYFAVLKPTIRSEAQSATRDEVSPALLQLSEQIGDLAKAAGQPVPPAPELAGGGGGGGDATEPPSTQTADQALGGEPTSGRLEIKSDQNPASYTVDDGRTLRLTDLVLQNPQGDAGLLTVSSGGATLLTVRLENFRDLDYHFVAPIVVEGGKQLTISVQCQNTDPNKTCSPAALFSGALVES